MFDDRKELQKLQSQVKEYNQQIKYITTHPNGMSYGICLKHLIYDSIHEFHGKMTPKIYSIYCEKRKEISTFVDVKSQVWTKSEYEKALEYIKNNWDYPIPETYQI